MEEWQKKKKIRPRTILRYLWECSDMGLLPSNAELGLENILPAGKCLLAI